MSGTQATAPSALLVVGGDVVDAGLTDTVGDLAVRTRTGVLNSYRAKGMFPFDHPAHLGTIGLQRDDLALAGVADVIAAGGTVVAAGAPELDGMLPDGVVHVPPATLSVIDLPVAPDWPARPVLYDALAAVCGPAYADDGVPLSPIRAAGDLATWLPDDVVVVGAADVAGFWLGRTFPTRHPGSVRLPAHRGTESVGTAVRAIVDAGRRALVVVATATPALAHLTDLERRGIVAVERWSPTGPTRSPVDRIATLDAAYRNGSQHLPATDVPPVIEVGVNVWDLAPVEEVAGPVVAWGGLDRPSGS